MSYKYKLSVICPGIRTQNWLRLYDSVAAAFHGEWEIVFVGPYLLPRELEDKDNITFIRDWGSPIRCQQIGLIASCGENISWAADDGAYFPNALNIAIAQMPDFHTVVNGRYREGENSDAMLKDEYYTLSTHDSSIAKYIPKDYQMLNCGVVPRDLLIEVGGWDAETFEVCPYAYSDLAIRLQRKGVKFILQKEPMFWCSHTPGQQGDHGPIHLAQIYHDQLAFNNIYDDPESETRIGINLENWRNAPEKWMRRFGK